MIETITIVLAIILIAMVMLLAVLCVLYFKSKNKKEKSNIETKSAEGKKGTKTNKNYSVESVFDFMEFDTIEDNMISTKNGSKYVMVVECQGNNYDLMSEVE